MKIMDKLGLDLMEFEPHNTSMPFETQFWEQYDYIMELNEEKMMEELPYIVLDPRQKSKVEALMAGRQQEILDHDSSKKLSTA